MGKIAFNVSVQTFCTVQQSFSWWAQYLSNEKKKIVVAPDIWYKTGKHAKADLYQDDWKLIHIG